MAALLQSELFGGLNTSIKDSVASWTQNPDHVSLAITNHPPFTVPFELWTMDHFEDAGFIAVRSLTYVRQIGVQFSKSSDKGVAPMRPPSRRIVIGHRAYFLHHELSKLLSSSFRRACVRTILLVGTGRFLPFEGDSANATIDSDGQPMPRSIIPGASFGCTTPTKMSAVSRCSVPSVKWSEAAFTIPVVDVAINAIFLCQTHSKNPDSLVRRYNKKGASFGIQTNKILSNSFGSGALLRSKAA